MLLTNLRRALVVKDAVEGVTLFRNSIWHGWFIRNMEPASSLSQRRSIVVFCVFWQPRNKHAVLNIIVASEGQLSGINRKMRFYLKRIYLHLQPFGYCRDYRSAISVATSAAVTAFTTRLRESCVGQICFVSAASQPDDPLPQMQAAQHHRESGRV